MAKKKIGKHLQFYMDCMKNECRMPYIKGKYYGGLCSIANRNVIDKSLFRLFAYSQNDFKYWASEDDRPYSDRFVFTGLRQTIVLFMACLNNEL
jgi:hypothetical protein